MPRDVDQRRFADHRGGGDDFGREQERQGGGAAGEARSDQPHNSASRDRQRDRDPDLGGDDPVGHLAHLGGDRALVARRDVARDHRSQHRLEAGLELGRQRGHLLRDIINADEGRAEEQPEDREIDPARGPFDRVGGGQRAVAPRRPPGGGKVRPPPARQAVAAHQRDDCGDQRRDHRDHIGNDQAVAQRVE